MKTFTNRFIKHLCAMCLIVALLFPFNTILTSFAVTENNYIQTHEQINFTNLDIAVINQNDLIVTISDNASLFKKYSAYQQKEKFEAFIAKDPRNIDFFLDALNNGENLTAFSYTEAPLEFVDNHFERIKKTDSTITPLNILANAASNSSNGHSKYYFTLTTKITRTGTSSPYTYTAITSGQWSDNSILGGEKYPASGNDFVLQSCPYTTYDDTFSCKYNNNVGTSGSVYGRKGTEYWAENGGNCYIRYGVKDDPIGNEQLVSFSMSQKFQTSETSKIKKINSYYVHTWKQMTISVGIQASSGAEKSVGLEITPGIADKQWQLYDYVVCNW